MATLYSDSVESGVFAGRNAIINGNFLSWARGQTFNPWTTGYTADRWRGGETTDGSMRADLESTIKPNDDVNYTLKLTVLTADTSLATTQYAHTFQRIEGYNYLQFIGRTATLSFWVRSSVTGTYSVSFRNGGLDRSYIAEYTIDNANTWEYKTITVKFDYTGGTWDTTTGVGLDVMFNLGCGSTYSAAAGSWLSGNYIASTNQVNWMATAGNTFYLSNVQLELGSEASPYEVLETGLHVLKIRRYYEAKYYYHQSLCTGTYYNWNMCTYFYKRVNPTITYSGVTVWARTAWYNATDVNMSGIYNDRFQFRVGYTTATMPYGAALIRGTFYMDAEL